VERRRHLRGTVADHALVIVGNPAAALAEQDVAVMQIAVQ
jgi:hypothetical protein